MTRGNTTETVGRRRRSRKSSKLSGKLQWALICLLSIGLLISLVFSLVSRARLDDQHALIEEEQAVYQRRVSRTTVKYRSLIEKYAREYGVRPAYLAAIILNESSYDPNAYVANTQARGLMQLIPSARTYVKGTVFENRKFTDDEMFEPELNICIGANYIRILSDRYGGDPVLVACAYHAGPNNVDYWLYRYSADHKTLRWSEIPKVNTRDYARKVVDAYAIYNTHYYQESGSLVPRTVASLNRRTGTGDDL